MSFIFPPIRQLNRPPCVGVRTVTKVLNFTVRHKAVADMSSWVTSTSVHQYARLDRWALETLVPLPSTFTFEANLMFFLAANTTKAVNNLAFILIHPL